MGVAKNIILGFVSFLLVLSFSLTILLGSANMLLYPQVYQTAFDDNNAYDFIKNELNKNSGSSIEIPEEGLRLSVNSLFENLLSYIRGDSENLNLKIELTNENLKSFVKENLKNLPVCKDGEEPFAGEKVVCMPSGKTSDEFADEVVEKNNLGNQQIDMGEAMGFKEENLQQAKSYVQTYKLILYGLIFFSALMILLCFVLSLDDISVSARFLGTSLMISGISVIVSIFVSSGVLTKILSESAVFSSISIANGVTQSLFEQVFSRAKIYSYASLGIGIASFAFSIVLGKIQSNK